MKSLASAKFFRDMRIKKGLTQEDVANFLGYSSKQIVSNWERGLCMPPLNKLAQLVKVLGMDKSDVLEVFINETQELVQGHLNGKKSQAKKRA